MAIVFALCVVAMFFISTKESQKGVNTNGLEVDTTMFKVTPAFTVGALVITGITAALYTIFW
jgi:SSS family solute:Na+ symporter